MKVVRSLFILCLSMLAPGTFAQESVPIGQWRSHLPYNSVRQMVETPDRIYVVGEIGFYSFHKQSGEMEAYSKVNGFSDTEVAYLAWSDPLKTLVIGYKNTNVDLLKEERVINIQGILRKQVIGVKEINEIKIVGSLAYLACSFGVVVIDMETEDIKDSYLNIGPGGTTLPVTSIDVFGDSLFIGSPVGLHAAEISPQVNLSDFSSWGMVRSNGQVKLLRTYDNRLYFVEDSLMYAYSTGFSLPFGPTREDYRSLSVDHGKLVVCYEQGIDLWDGQTLYRSVPERFKDFAILDHQDNVWTGGFYTGMVKVSPQGALGFLKPQGPFGPTSFEMEGYGTQMWVTSGGHSTIYAPTFTNSGYYMFEKGDWVNRPTGNAELSGMYDFTSIQIDPDRNEIWMGTHGTGLCQLRDGEFVARYDADNTPVIKATVNGFSYCLGLGQDSKGDLWVTNFEAPEALLVRRTNGSWESFDVKETRLGEMVIDQYDQKWISLEREASKGILVFKEDEAGVNTPDIRVLGTSTLSGNLPNNAVNALVLDKDGEIWVGTEAGLAIFYNPQLVFDPTQRANADAQQIIIDDGNDIGYLLGNEVINDIKIDGANRKWIATNNGAWLVKEDGSEVLRHFTADNSPLPSNTVNCVGVEPVSGEVFFGTNGGIVSFRSDATEANSMESHPLIFPNPVHKGYEGPITITGLYENASVTITDIAGRVVYEMIATGGTAVWDGRNFQGELPKSGVYLIFTSNEEDEDSLISKLMIIR